MKVSDRQREPLCRERLGEASGLYDVAIIEHGVDRVRGVLRPEESVAFAAPGEAHPRPWQIAGFSLSVAQYEHITRHLRDKATHQIEQEADEESQRS